MSVLLSVLSFVNNNAIVIALSLFVLMFSVYFLFKIEKISVFLIVKNHIETLKSLGGDGRIRKCEVVFFFVLPILIALIISLKYKFTESSGLYIVTGFSIFTGLLLNLLLLIFDILRKSNVTGNGNVSQSDYNAGLVKKLIKETYSNISFGVLLSMVTVALSFSFIVSNENEIISYVLSSVMYFFIINFILTLLMILKRINALLLEEIKRI